jgi:hypothetical protein
MASSDNAVARARMARGLKQTKPWRGARESRGRRCAAVAVIAGALPCSSQRVLGDLVDSRAHVAGVHLRDQKSGEYNLAPIRRAMGSRHSPVVNFARLEIELTMAPNHPLAIHGFAELASAYDTTEIGKVTHT